MVLLGIIIIYSEYRKRNNKTIQEIDKKLNQTIEGTLTAKELKKVLAQQNRNTELLQKLETRLNTVELKTGYRI